MKKFKNKIGFTGSVELRKAMVEELLKIGYIWKAVSKTDYEDYRITVSNYKDGFGLGNLDSNFKEEIRECTLFNLPEQWDECLKAASEVEVDIPEYIECVDNMLGYTTHSRAYEYGCTNYAYNIQLVNNRVYKTIKEVIINAHTSSPTQGYSCEDNGKHYLIMKRGVKPSTKEAYLAQQEEEFVLPEKWCVKITVGNREILEKYRKTTKFYKPETNITALVEEALNGWLINTDYFSDGMCWIYNKILNYHTEITFEQFKKYVLKEENMKILPNEYIVECNKKEYVMEVINHYYACNYDWSNWKYIICKRSLEKQNRNFPHGDVITSFIQKRYSDLPVLTYGQWKQLINKQTDMKKDFTIEGTEILKKAFVEASSCKESCIEYSCFLTSSSNKEKSLTSISVKMDKHFILPQQWNEALEYVKEYFKEEEFKVGDWVIANYSSGNSLRRGQIAKVLNKMNYQYLDGFIEENNSNFSGCRKATQEEIDNATKPTVGDYLYITNTIESNSQKGDIVRVNSICNEEYGIWLNYTNISTKRDGGFDLESFINSFRIATQKEVDECKVKKVTKLMFGKLEFTIVEGEDFATNRHGKVYYQEFVNLFDYIKKTPLIQGEDLKLDNIQVGCEDGTWKEFIAIKNAFKLK